MMYLLTKDKEMVEVTVQQSTMRRTSNEENLVSRTRQDHPGNQGRFSPFDGEHFLKLAWQQHILAKKAEI
jgi:hypothetical protein